MARSTRRQPRQQRSQATVQAIFGAVARIVTMEGERALNTNRIARLAGVSVGSLYQYFPSKEAIVAAMVDEQRRALLRELSGGVEKGRAGGLDPTQLIRRYVQSYLRAFGGAEPALLPLQRLAWRMDQHEAIVAAVREVSEQLAQQVQRLGAPRWPVPSPARLFVLTRGFVGVVRSALLEGSPLVGTQALEDELVQLCVRALAGEPAAKRPKRRAAPRRRAGR